MGNNQDESYRFSPFKQAPMLKYALLMMMGISLGRFLEEHTTSTLWTWLSLASIFLMAIAYYWGRHRPKTRSFTFFFGALSIIWTMSGLYCLHVEQTVVKWEHGEKTWTLQVKAIDKVLENAVSIEAEIVGETAPYSGKMVRARLIEGNVDSLLPGSTLAVYGEITRPALSGNPGDFDYAAYLLTHHISGTLYAEPGRWDILSHTSGNDWHARLLRFRQTLITQYFSQLEFKEAAILSALTLGDKAYLDNDIREAFTETGTSHILALSGLHLSIIFALINLLFLRYFRKRGTQLAANSLALLLLWIFVVMAGMPLSLVRAACMFSLLQIGVALMRSHSATFNNLSTAAVLILLFDPLALFDISFQLSFSAVAGILLCNQYIWSRLRSDDSEEWRKRKIKLAKEGKDSLLVRIKLYLHIPTILHNLCRNWILPFCYVSIGAQLGTLPLTLYYFHLFTPYALLANVIVIPSAYILLGGSFLFLLTPIEEVRHLTVQVLDGTLRGMTSGLNRIGSWPGATVYLYPTTLTLVALTILVFLLFAISVEKRYYIRKKLIFASSLCILATIGSGIWQSAFGNVKSEIIIYRLKRATAVHFIASKNKSYIVSSLPADSLRLALTNVQNNFFAPKDINYPLYIPDTSWHDKDIVASNNYYNFQGTTLYILNKNITTTSKHPLTPDVLLVCRGCTMDCSDILRTFSPQMVVLDNTLPYYLYEKWKEFSHNTHRPIHDLRRDGAYILPTKNKTISKQKK